MFASLLLKILPFKGYLIAAAAVAIALFIGGQYVEIQHLHTTVATDKAAFAQAKQVAEAAALKQSEANRLTEEARAKAQREADDEAAHEIAIAQVDAAAAAVAATSLHDRYAAALAALRRASANPAADPSGKAAEGTARMLADVQQRMDTAARQLAALADARGAAGLACEREYDSLSAR